MYQIFNFNGYLRDNLYNIYSIIVNDCDNRLEIKNRFKSYILNLKNYNYSLYKSTINLLFTDSYMILRFKDLYNKLDDNEEYIFNLYKSILNVDELLDIMEDDDSIVDSFLTSSISFKTLNKVNQSYRMLTDEEYSKFLPYSYLEKLSIFGDITLEQLNSNYQKLYMNHMELDAIDNFIDEIFIRSYGNINNFKTLLTDILNYFCSCKEKVVDIKSNYFVDIDQEILRITKSKNIDDIVEIFIHDNELLNYLIKEYLYNKFQRSRAVEDKEYVKELKKEVSL